MSENRESGPSVTGVLSNTNSFVQRASNVLSQNISDVEKEQLIRQMLESQVAGDGYTVPPQPSGEKVGNETQQANVGNCERKHREDRSRHREDRPRHCRNPRDERDEWRGHRGRHHKFGLRECNNNGVPDVTVSDIIEPFMQLQSPFIPSPFDIIERQHPIDRFMGRGRRFIGPFDLMEPTFFGTSRLQRDVGRMFNDQEFNELEQECKLEENKENEEESKHLKFTSKLVSIGPDGVKRSRVVNGVTKIGKDGKPITHKKMISSDESGKTITEVFADGTERTTKRPFIKGKDHDEDSD